MSAVLSKTNRFLRKLSEHRDLKDAVTALQVVALPGILLLAPAIVRFARREAQPA
jgi:hypothetical protein